MQKTRALPGLDARASRRRARPRVARVAPGRAPAAVLRPPLVALAVIFLALFLFEFLGFLEFLAFI